jgi:23S rRNA pseudouridine1911/1915/1917 synthase
MANLEVSRAQRLDQYVVQERPRLSRAYAVKLIDEGKVLVNGQLEKPGYKLRAADRVTIDFDEAVLDIIPPIDLPVLYEDDNVIVIDKPAGVISHARGRYWDEASVASFVRQRVSQLKDEHEVAGEVSILRAGIVHRLDRATSGVMICSKNATTMAWLQKQFSQRNVKKQYRAIVKGHLEPPEAIIDMPIERNPKAPATFRVGANGKPAQTTYKALRSVGDYDLVELTPLTGRTHQLRVHLKAQGHSIIGDHLYDGEPADRLYLHAEKLEITLPGGERKVLEAPLPAAFGEFLKHHE